jgi:hypothetical protein
MFVRWHTTHNTIHAGTAADNHALSSSRPRVQMDAIMSDPPPLSKSKASAPENQPWVRTARSKVLQRVLTQPRTG